MFAETIHSTFRVIDEERSVAFYRCALWLEVADRYPRGGFPIVYLGNAASPFELTVNGDHDKPYDKGYGHLAVLVDDLQTENERMKSEGPLPTDIKSLDLGGKAQSFFVNDPDSYAIEAIGRSGCFSRS